MTFDCNEDAAIQEHKTQSRAPDAETMLTQILYHLYTPANLLLFIFVISVMKIDFVFA